MIDGTSHRRHVWTLLSKPPSRRYHGVLRVGQSPKISVFICIYSVFYIIIWQPANVTLFSLMESLSRMRVPPYSLKCRQCSMAFHTMEILWDAYSRPAWRTWNKCPISLACLFILVKFHFLHDKKLPFLQQPLIIHFMALSRVTTMLGRAIKYFQLTYHQNQFLHIH